MSLLGFDALGHFALGHPPDPTQSATLTASVGGFVLTGQASGFTFKAPEFAGAFALTGVAESVKISEAPLAGGFSLGGVSATFLALDRAAAGSVALSGLSTTDMIGEPVNPPGSFAFTGFAAAFSANFAALTAGSFGLASPGAVLTRDFVNWVDRSLPASLWDSEGAPSCSWTAANPQTSSWNAKSAPVPAWSTIAPPSPGWTIDPTQHILSPVSE